MGDTIKQRENSTSRTGEGVAAPLEPSQEWQKFFDNYCVRQPLEPTPQLEDNNHWKWFIEIGQKLCPQAEQQWHKDDPHICRPCEFAKKVAELYAAAVSKNLQEERDQFSKMAHDLRKIAEEKTLLVHKLGGKLDKRDNRISELESEITALRETK